MENSPAIQHS